MGVLLECMMELLTPPFLPYDRFTSVFDEGFGEVKSEAVTTGIQMTVTM